MLCLHCQRDVKVNQIVRSAHHDLGCVFCYGKPDTESRSITRTAVEGRPFNVGGFSLLTPGERARKLAA